MQPEAAEAAAPGAAAAAPDLPQLRRGGPGNARGRFAFDARCDLYPRMYLIGDIGGTSVRLALAQAGQILPDTLWRAPAGTEDFRAILAQYRAVYASGDIEGVAIAAAGAPRDGLLPLTNRAMVLDPEDIRAELGQVPVTLFNDMVGQGHGLSRLGPDGLRHLAGPQTGQGARLVVNIGTGLNACVVHEGPAGTFVPPSEAGNVTLPQVTDSLRALAGLRGGEVVAEDVISGRALPWLAKVLAERDNQQGAGALAHEAVQRVIADALAAYMRDMVLCHMATGGIFLTGGVSMALADVLDWTEVHAAMVGGRAYADLLARVPVTLVTDPHVALRGCAAIAGAQT